MKPNNALVSLMLILMLLFINIQFISIGDTLFGPPPPTGDWIVSDHTQINDTNLEVFGNLTVTSSGILELTNVTLIMNGNVTINGDFILRNCTLVMNSTGLGNASVGTFGIVVESGGLMHILDYDNNPATNDSSMVTSGIKDGIHIFTFWVKTGSSFKLENSEVQYCGFGSFLPAEGSSKGLVIETDSVHMKNSTISNSNNGVIIYSSNNIVVNCTFSRGTSFPSPLYGTYGLTFLRSDNNLINRCKFININESLTLISSDYNNITNCYFEDNVALLNDNRQSRGVYSIEADSNRFYNNTQKKIYWSLYFSNSKYVNVKNHTIMETCIGIFFDGFSQPVTLENVDILNVYNPNPFFQRTAGLFFYSTKSYVNVTNCTIQSDVKSYTDGILWRYPGLSTNQYFKNCTIFSTAVAIAAHAFRIPSSEAISNVVFEDSTFIGGDHAMAALYKLNNWAFKNCSFEKFLGGTFYLNANGGVCISNEVNDLVFSNCSFTYTGLETDVNGFMINSYYDDFSFDIEINNSFIFDNSKNGLIIEKMGNNLDGTILLDNTSVVGNGNHGLKLDSAEVVLNLKYCNISQNYFHGIRTEFPHKSKLIVENCIISENSATGISIYNADSSNEFIIKNSLLRNNPLGALKTWYSNCNFKFQNTDFLYNNPTGINITSGIIEIDNCNFSDNIGTGIKLDSTIFNISNSNISFNSNLGLELIASKGNIIGNQMEDNYNGGIKIDGGQDSYLIKDNILKNNGYYNLASALYLKDAIASIRNNTFITTQNRSQKNGVEIINSDLVEIQENIFNGQFSEAIIDIKQSSGQIEQNYLLNCLPQSYGIYCHDESSVLIFNNTITAPGKYGIYIFYNSYAPIMWNTISGWDSGINIHSSNSPIENNNLVENENGIHLKSTSANINNNSIRDTNNCSIFIEDDVDVDVTDNEIISSKFGILIEGFARINRNMVEDSTHSGIYVKNGAEVQAYENTISGNDIGILIESGNLITNNNQLLANKCGISFLNTDSVTLENDLIKGSDIAIEAEYSNFNISDYSFETNTDTISLINTLCKIYNSSIFGSDRNFILDDRSLCLLLNTRMDDGLVNILDEFSKLEQQWYLNLTIVDVELNPLPDIRVVIKDNEGIEILNQLTSKSGIINLLNITAKRWSLSEIADLNPFEIILSKTGFGTINYGFNFTENTNSSFTALRLSDIITDIRAYDTPNDQGGSITLKWNYTPILNFDHFNIYVDNKFLFSVSHINPINSDIKDQNVNSIVISEINGEQLENGNEYYFAITVVDTNGEENWAEVVCSNAVIPMDNIAPEPVKNFKAFDTPNDDGGSITVTWKAVTAVDFDYYLIYCLPQNVSNTQELLNLTPKTTIRLINFEQEIFEELIDNTTYYFAILVYDINGNVNLSVPILAITPFDNIPPKIDRGSSEPPVVTELEFTTDETNIFIVYLETQEDVTFQWFLNGVLLVDEVDNYYLLTLADLIPGSHNLSMIVTEDSGLQDSIQWNFTVSKAREPGQKDSSQIIVIWVALVILLFVILILTIFGVRQVHRYQEARKTLKTLPMIGETQALALINKKRKLGDRYTLQKIMKDLPEQLKSRPDKLFSILRILAKDDILEIWEDAAKNIAILLDRNPNNMFAWFKSLQTMGVKPEIYQTISKTARNEIIKGLAKWYHSNLTAKDEDEYKFSLEGTVLLLKRTEDLFFGREISIIYSTLMDFIKFRTVSRISTSKPIIDNIKNLGIQSPNLLHPEAIEVFHKMGMVAEALGKYEKVDTVEDKLNYLSQGLNWLEDASRTARVRLIPPEKDLFILAIESWRNIITMSIRELRGRADLSLSLIGKETIANQEKVMVMLELDNTGRSIAERVLVEIVPSNDYVVLTGPQEAGTIGQNKKKEVSFELKPRTTNAFRVEFAIHYDDAERKGKSISFGDLITFIDVGGEFQEIPNPYVVGTPIKTGSELFVGRRDLIDFIQKNIKGSLQENIIVLIGHRRTGKTTLLQQLPVYLDKLYIPVYIDIQGIIDPGMDAFFYLLATEITNGMKNRGIEIATPAFEQFEERPSFYFEYEFLKEVNEKLGESILILMFDEFEELQVKVESGLLDKNIFSYLRHLMQHTERLAFIFTGSSRLEDLKTDYWSIMFNIALYKRISFLSETETKQLITEPVEKYNMIYDSLAIEKIYRLTSGHPYFTQLLCHALVNLHNREHKNYITIQDVNGELNKIIERGQMHFDFIWDRSSSLERLVMTSLSRVFHEEDAVTVSSIVNKSLEYGLTVEAADVSKTLDMLAGKDIITKILDHTTTYEFKVDLIRIWLEQTKHLDQVVEMYRSGA